MAYSRQEFSDSFWQVSLVQYLTYFMILHLRRVALDASKKVWHQEFNDWNALFALRLGFKFQLVLAGLVLAISIDLFYRQACIVGL